MNRNDLLILTNGSVLQVENKLEDINQQLDFAFPKSYSVVYVSSIVELAVLSTQGHFTVLFMFFNGLEYVRKVINDCIDYIPIVNSMPAGKAQVCDCYFYFDSLVVEYEVPISNKVPIESVDFTTASFDHMISVVSDVLKKLGGLVSRVKGIVLDDMNLTGEKIFAVNWLLKHHVIERVELSSDVQNLQYA